MITELIINFSHLAVFLLIMSILFLLVKFKRVNFEIKVFLIFLLVNLIIELLTRIFIWSLDISNLPLLHFYTLLEFASLSFFYKFLFKDISWFQKYFWQFFISVIILIIANTIFLEPINGFNSNAKAMVQIILIGYSIIYFFNAFGVTDYSKNVNQSIGLINFAVILYYSGSLFIFMFTQTLLKNKVEDELQLGFWLLNALLNVIFQLLILIAIWKVAFSKTKSLS